VALGAEQSTWWCRRSSTCWALQFLAKDVYYISELPPICTGADVGTIGVVSLRPHAAGERCYPKLAARRARKPAEAACAMSDHSQSIPAGAAVLECRGLSKIFHQGRDGCGPVLTGRRL